MISKAWALIKDTVSGFLEHEDLTRGAAIAYYTIFSIAPLLIIVIAIAGLVFGHDAAEGAIVGQLGGLIGKQSAEILQSMIQSASHQATGIFATIIGIGTLLLTATGAFTEIQSALNAIWKAAPSMGFSELVRARLVSLGLVATFGFLMLVSLVVSAGLTALGSYLSDLFPGGRLLMSLLNSTISLVLISALFAAIYKILPDTPVAWRDVAVGSMATAILFTIGNPSLDSISEVAVLRRATEQLARCSFSCYGSTILLRFSCSVPNVRARTPKRTGAMSLGNV